MTTRRVRSKHSLVRAGLRSLCALAVTVIAGVIAPISHDASAKAPPLATAVLDAQALAAPDYDNIVGGVPPSPFASLILLGGIVCLVASAAGTAAGADMTQWWILGAMLVAVAVFLAGFVSRG